MLKDNITRLYNFFVLSVLLPVIYGCGGGGGGGGSALGALFSPDGGGGGGGGLPGGGGGGEGLATIHNPEPATILLMGGGMAAMGLYRKHKKNSFNR